MLRHGIRFSNLKAYNWFMLRILFKTYLKKATVQLFSKLNVRLITNADVSKNGLFPFVVEFFLIQSSGILHIGAHTGQESNYYASLGKPVFWLEANPNTFENLKANVSAYSNQMARNVLVDRICNESSIFYLASNDSESSSIYELADNPIWQGLSNVGTITLPSHTLDCILKDEDISNLDYWVLDVQGGELAVLEGAKKSLLKYCSYLQIEVSQAEFYRGGAQYAQIRDYLARESFFPIWDPIASHEEIIFTKNGRTKKLSSI